MAQALAVGAHQSGALEEQSILLFDPVPEAVDALASQIGGSAAKDLPTLIADSDILLICVKPDVVSEILAVVASSGSKPENLLVISIAAGVSLTTMEGIAGPNARFVRVMPNTPALVSEGAAAYSLGSAANSADGETVEKLLSAVGTVTAIKESLMNAVTGLSGSGPAYVYTFIEALADGAVLEGIPREQALTLATQTVLGAAAMVKETGLHPAELRDRVTSPGGTTIAGLATLEEGGIRSATIKAVSRATRRAHELGGN